MTIEIYTDMIFCYVGKKSYDKAVSLWEETKQNRVKATAVLLNLMLEVAVETKNGPLQQEIVSEMWLQNIEPHPSYYGALRDLIIKEPVSALW